MYVQPEVILMSRISKNAVILTFPNNFLDMTNLPALKKY